MRKEVGSAPLIIILIVFVLVVIGGFWYYFNHKTAVPTVTSQTSKSFTDNQLGFAADPPSQWQHTFNKGDQYTDPSDTWVSISSGPFQGITPNGAAEIIVTKWSRGLQAAEDQIGSWLFSSSTVTVGGKQGTRYYKANLNNVPGLNDDYVLVSYNGHTYMILFQSNNYLNAESVFNQFLSSIEFI